ncbi:unnamed protein product [marine sediment metagenome]|uniref:Uncharacterized protein n=1 Tax=marine sediment metagenome TaxID=412755 RepID=X1A0U0_9ZZZZ
MVRKSISVGERIDAEFESNMNNEKAIPYFTNMFIKYLKVHKRFLPKRGMKELPADTAMWLNAKFNMMRRKR